MALLCLHTCQNQVRYHFSPSVFVMSMMGDRVLVSSTGRSRCLFSKGPQEEAGSWVQEKAEGHTQGIQKVTVQARKMANDVVREIRQEVDDRKSDR